MRVVLIAMPWHQADIVSIQLGALKAYLRRHKVEVETRHYYKDVVGYIGIERYRAILRANVGELFFAAMMYPKYCSVIARMLQTRHDPSISLHGCLRELRTYCNDISSELISMAPDVLGFSTTHVQLMGSLYMGRELKSRLPGCTIVFGGMSVYDDMASGLLGLFPFLDYVIMGEGEQAFLDLYRHLASAKPSIAIKQLAYRNDGKVILNDKKNYPENLDSLPTPDYEDYFAYRLPAAVELAYPRLSIEASRGCKWGRCSFCVENTRWRRAYRRKSAEKVKREIEVLSRRHRSLEIVFMDPDLADKRDLFDMLAACRSDINYSAEVSAIVDRETLKSMAQAGVRHIQIGIESFCNRLIQLYRKGGDLMKMVQLLKWCKQFGIEISYNIIIGAPFELKTDLDDIIQNMSFLSYFQPPIISKFVVSYGSRIFDDPGAFGIHSLAPPDEVTKCYPAEIASRIAPLLVFHAGYDFRPKKRLDYRPLLQALDSWWSVWNKGVSLLSRQGDGFLDIELHSGPEVEHTLITEPLDVKIYTLCMNDPMTLDELKRMLSRVSLKKIQQSVDDLIDSKLMFSDGNQYLSLAIASESYLQSSTTSTGYVPPRKK